MPVRATQLGQRPRVERDCDVLVCGASFAGLAVARELAGSGARVLVLDRYELGARQTSACAMPTLWLRALDLMSSWRQSFDELVVHTPFCTARWSLPWSFSTFDYRELCALLWGQAASPELELLRATVTGRDGCTVHTDRGTLTASLIVDALGWRRVLSNAAMIQPPNARLSRGLEVHPRGSGDEMELWIDPAYVRAGYSWSFPAREELRVGVGSFWPSHHVKEPTVRLARDLQLEPDGYQGNWIPHELRSAIEDGIFFAGDSAGHCLPLTAEGIRTALYFGLACGRELSSVIAGEASREQALARYGAFSAAHARKYRWLLGVQRGVGQITPSRALSAIVRAVANRRLASWLFVHYLAIAPPSFVDRGAAQALRGSGQLAAANA
jgi:digeranylgeranylglycerophospholipid reductase